MRKIASIGQYSFFSDGARFPRRIQTRVKINFKTEMEAEIHEMEIKVVPRSTKGEGGDGRVSEGKVISSGDLLYNCDQAAT